MTIKAVIGRRKPVRAALFGAMLLVALSMNLESGIKVVSKTKIMKGFRAVALAASPDDVARFKPGQRVAIFADFQSKPYAKPSGGGTFQRKVLLMTNIVVADVRAPSSTIATGSVQIACTSDQAQYIALARYYGVPLQIEPASSSRPSQAIVK